MKEQELRTRLKRIEQSLTKITEILERLDRQQQDEVTRQQLQQAWQQAAQARAAALGSVSPMQQWQGNMLPGRYQETARKLFGIKLKRDYRVFFFGFFGLF